MIAGHTFAETTAGRCCIGCGRRWIAIASASQADVGRPDIAHVGELTEVELGQIADERDRIWDALVGVAGGQGT